MLVQAPRKHPIKPAPAYTHQQPQRKFLIGNVYDDFSLMTWQDSVWSGAFCVSEPLLYCRQASSKRLYAIMDRHTQCLSLTLTHKKWFVFIIFKLCVYVCGYVWVGAHEGRCLWKPEEGVKTSQSWGYRRLCGCWELNSGSLRSSMCS